jgi:hypothetical protein
MHRTDPACVEGQSAGSRDCYYVVVVTNRPPGPWILLFAFATLHALEHTMAAVCAPSVRGTTGSTVHALENTVLNHGLSADGGLVSVAHQLCSSS